MESKKCTRCGNVKPIHYFGKRGNGYRSYCKPCGVIIVTKYQRTIEGLTRQIYKTQHLNSSVRKDSPPNYSIDQFRTWLLSQSNFNELYDNWVRSNYEKDLKPSVDRLDDYKGYSLDNIRLVTWMVNNIRGREDKKNGVNTKDCRAIIQYSKDGDFIKEHYSIMQAQRDTGYLQGNISSACIGTYKQAYGFIWKYANAL